MKTSNGYMELELRRKKGMSSEQPGIEECELYCEKQRIEVLKRGNGELISAFTHNRSKLRKREKTEQEQPADNKRRGGRAQGTRFSYSGKLRF
jgi:hypothetical protein